MARVKDISPLRSRAVSCSSSRPEGELEHRPPPNLEKSDAFRFPLRRNECTHTACLLFLLLLQFIACPFWEGENQYSNIAIDAFSRQLKRC